MAETPSRPTPLMTVIIAVGALLAGLAAALWLAQPAGSGARHGVILEQPRRLPAIEVVDESGRERALDSFTGEWTLVFPGFTYCPDICPATLAQLSPLADEVEGLQIRLFSVDPERDSAERMRDYVRHFNPRFGAFTSPLEQLPQVARALSVAYQKVPLGEDYTLDHSTALALIDPQGRVAGFFTPPFNVDGIAADLKGLINRRGRS